MEGDHYDSCSLSKLETLEDLQLRVKIKRLGVGGFELVDDSYLKLEYCYQPGVTCGNNLIEGDEECDDGNLRNADGCSQICKLERWFCGEWGACVDGQMTQTCTFGDELQKKTMPCETYSTKKILTTVLLILVIIVLILLILSPFIYPWFYGEKRKKRKH